MQRYISMDICDYTNTPLCNLYDSTQDLSGQATDVFVNTERNGYKDLTFKLPSTCSSEEGEERNYRLDFLISDYRIRLRVTKRNTVSGVITETTETDWFLVSESRVQHSNFSTDYDIQAKHISQLLNTKNLDLEFSDDEGNNTGTIGQIAQTILEGTGWHLANVYTFMEEDKYLKSGVQVEKVRSFTASAKTGAFKMMSDLCELFDAKPIYHGEGTYTGHTIRGTKPDHTQYAIYGQHYDEYEVDKYLKTAADSGWMDLVVEVEQLPVVGRTVDLIPMNPFSEDLSEGSIPEEVLNQGVPVLELHYDKNVKNITRTLNTENIVTKLTAYGSYGDRSGMASLQKAEHTEISFSTLTAGEYEFVHNNVHYYFKLTRTESGLKWSDLDFVSRSYVYNNSRYYRVYKEPEGTYSTITGTAVYVKNELPYVMDFSYYDKIGLLTEEMFAALVNFQKTMPQNHLAAEEASLALMDAKAELTRTASDGEGFAKLDIQSASLDSNGNLRLKLNKTTYPDGVIYRSDYDEAKRNYFTWSTAVGMKNNGEAISGKGSVVYIVKQGSSTTYIKSYVRALGNATDNYYRDQLGNIYTLHNTLSYPTRDNFPSTGVANNIYYAEDSKKMYTWRNYYTEIQASNYTYGLNEFPEPDYITLWTSGTWSSSDKVYLFSSDSIAGLFGPREDSIASNQKAIQESVKVTTETHPMTFVYGSQAAPDYAPCVDNYGWYYRIHLDTFSFGDLYFCDSDDGWQTVKVSNGNTVPASTTEPYFYSLRRMMLYKRIDNDYVPINETTDDKRLLEAFAVVIAGCINQEILFKGYKEEYYYSDSEPLQVGNYAFKNEFENYWLFTTTQDIDPSHDGQLRYKSSERIIWQDENENHIIKPVEYTFRSLNFAKPNDLKDASFANGSYTNGVFSTEGNQFISDNIPVFEKTPYEYTLPSNSVVVCLSEANRVLGEYRQSPFTTPLNTTHVRIVCNSQPTASHTFHVVDYWYYCFSNNKPYKVIPWTATGERLGMAYLMDKFIQLADDTYMVKLPALRSAQQTIKEANVALANMLGDMYREGFWQENDYVEGDENKLYMDSLDNLKEISHPQATYDLDFLDLYDADENLGAEIETDWPDIEITYAAHLVDTDIDTNKWAYIDKVNKCYDQKWKTKIEINTRLSMIGQQSFTDVLARIAEVAEEVKAKQTIYKRADVLTGSGKLAAERLEGAIQANKLYILGGTSNWYTDTKGNIIFEAADGESAMMLSGRGWAIADTKDQFGDWDFRYIATGKGLTADAIYTGYLSAERIEAGSITTDKLSASVGQELEISSNKSLALFATTDGSRPAGSLLTQHPGQNDSWIEIAAKNGNDPAHIAIKSGGQINIEGTSSVNIGSSGELNLNGGSVNINSSGELNVGSQSQINVQSGGKIVVSAEQIQLGSGETLKSALDSKGDVTESVQEYYVSTSSQSATGGSWSTGTPQWSSDKYIWSRTKVTHADQSVTYMPSEAGVCIQGAKGESGGTGKGISAVTEYYLIYVSNTGVTRSTSGWSTTVQTPTKAKPYLWNYEKITYTSGDPTYTDPAVIGTYAEDGRSITGVVEYYLASASSSGVTRSTSGWTTTIQTISASKKYLWNYEKITFSSGDPSYTDPVIIGTYGDDGAPGADGKSVGNIETRYKLGTSYTVEPTGAWSTWSTTLPAYQAGKYYWTWTKTYLTDGTEINAPGVKLSELGVNAAYDKAADAYTLADNIINGTQNAFYAKNISNTGVTVDETTLHVTSQGNMYIDSGGALIIRNSTSTAGNPQNAVVMNNTGIALQTTGKLTAAANSIQLTSGNNTFYLGDKLESLVGDTVYYGVQRPLDANGNYVTPGNRHHGDTWIQGDRDAPAAARTWQKAKDREVTWDGVKYSGNITWGVIRGWQRSFTWDGTSTTWVQTSDRSYYNAIRSRITQTNDSITLAVSEIKNDYLLKSYVGVSGNSVILSSLKFDSLGASGSGILVEPTKIDINSTGSLNVKLGGNLNIEGGGNIDIKADGKLSLETGGAIDVKSGGNITINSGGSFVLTSTNFSVTANGTITSKAGTIGGWNIGTTSLYNGTANMTSTDQGVYLGTDGIRLVGADNMHIFQVTSACKVIIKSGMTSVSDTTNTDGMYFDSANGFALGGGNFKVTNAGAITAKSGKIATWNIGTNSLYNGPSSVGQATAGTFLGTTGLWIYYSARYSLKMDSTSSNFTLMGGKPGIGCATENQYNGVYIGNDGIALGRSGSSGSYVDAFSVTSAGVLTAKSGTIAGWSIGTTSLYNGTTGMTSNTKGIFLAPAGIRIYSDSTHIFHLPVEDGHFYLAAGMSSLSANTNGAYIGYDGIALGGGKFKVTNAGSLTATDGTIGGWSLSSSTPKRLYSGSGTGYIALDCDNTLTNPNAAFNATSNDWAQPYAIWCGNATASSAPFRVRRDGKVYINKLMVWDGSKYVEENFSQNFYNATQPVLTAGWGGNTYTVYANRGKRTEVHVSTSCTGVSQTSATPTVTGKWIDAKCTVEFSGDGGSWTSNSLDIRINGEGAYNNGYDDGVASVTITNIKFNGVPAPSATSAEVIATASNGATKTWTVSMTPQRNDAYDKGWNDCLAACTLTGSANAWYKGTVSQVMIQGSGYQYVVSPYYTQTVDVYTLPAAR